MSSITLKTSDGDVFCTVPREPQMLDVLRAAIDIIEESERRRVVGLLAVFGLGEGDD